MRTQKTLIALLLLCLWLPATSHELLESAELIHQQDAPSTDSDHDAADGLVLLPPSVNAPVTSAVLVCVLPVVVFLLPEPVETRLMDQIESGTSPPLPNIWQFVHRAALPVRAPSFAS